VRTGQIFFQASTIGSLVYCSLSRHLVFESLKCPKDLVIVYTKHSSWGQDPCPEERVPCIRHSAMMGAPRTSRRDALEMHVRGELANACVGKDDAAGHYGVFACQISRSLMHCDLMDTAGILSFSSLRGACITACSVPRNSIQTTLVRQCPSYVLLPHRTTAIRPCGE